MKMTDKELDEIFETAQKNVEVGCDEQHAHSALAGCLVPKSGYSETYVTICELVEVIRFERRIVREVVDKLGSP